MATVRIVMDVATAARRGLGQHPKASIVGETGNRVELPLAPLIERSGLGSRFVAFERVGRKGLNVRAGQELKSYSVTMLVVGRNGEGFIDDQVSIEPQLGVLESMAQSGERIRLEGYGPRDAGWFQITSLSDRTVRMKHGTNETTQAEVTMTLTEAGGVSSSVAHVGPLTGGAEPAPAAPAPAEVVGPAAPAGQSYTVVRGDTLWAIAGRFYGDPLQWRRIADANGITVPKLLQVGKVLTIPPK